MLTKKTLENINDSMLKRNKVSGSMIGYNYSDKKSCELYQHGITDQQALHLCIKLKKYANNQLNVSEKEIVESENYYRDLIDGSKDRLPHERPFINIRMVHDDYSYVTFKYNKLFISTVRENGGVWMPKDLAWKIDNKVLESVLFDLETQNGNISECLRVIKEDRQIVKRYHHNKALVI